MFPVEQSTAGILASGVFPAVHAADPIVLRYLGTAVNQDKAIAEKFKADTGIEIQYVAVTTDDVTKRAVTAPNSFDLIDTEYFSLKKIVPTGNLKGIDVKKIKNADKITTLFTKGEVGGKAVGDQGTAPKKVMYLDQPDSKTFSAAPTQFMTLIPTVYNADTLGIRPDKISRPIESWYGYYGVGFARPSDPGALQTAAEELRASAGKTSRNVSPTMIFSSESFVCPASNRARSDNWLRLLCSW